jgi:hypothetical protein
MIQKENMNRTLKKSGCLICGQQLIYLQKSETLDCFYCHESHEIDVKCRENHFVCDRCHSRNANDLIERYCSASRLTNPIKLAREIMNNPLIPMHGPEHHFLVPAVLLACHYNIMKDERLKKEKIVLARKRAQKVPGGFCGSHGACGAAIGTGIFISLMLKATPLSEREWKLCNKITARSLGVIAHYGGPRCCKRDTFLAIIEAVQFLEKHLHVSVSLDEDRACRFYSLNSECKLKACPFYGKNES